MEMGSAEGWHSYIIMLLRGLYIYIYIESVVSHLTTCTQELTAVHEMTTSWSLWPLSHLGKCTSLNLQLALGVRSGLYLYRVAYNQRYTSLPFKIF